MATTSIEWSGAERAARRQAAFRAARRHTRVVHLLRKAIPVGAALAAAWMIASPFLLAPKAVSNLSLQSVGISGGKVRMEAPRLSGYRKDNRPYEVAAEAALQDIRNPTQIELQTLTARLQAEREGWITVKARSGFFNSQSEKLQLSGDVNVRTESGYDIRMRSADIDFKAGTVVSREPVEVDLGGSTVSSDAIDVRDNGAAIAFEGRVRAVFTNAPARAIAGPEREGSTPRPELLKQNSQPGSPATETRR